MFEKGWYEGYDIFLCHINILLSIFGLFWETVKNNTFHFHHTRTYCTPESKLIMFFFHPIFVQFGNMPISTHKPAHCYYSATT